MYCIMYIRIRKSKDRQNNDQRREKKTIYKHYTES